MGVLSCEKKTVEAMVRIYCRGLRHDRAGETLCAACRGLLGYSHERLDRCVFGEQKSVCARCPVHCYRPDRRAEIRHVMRFSGPRMLLWHPWLAVLHMIDQRKPYSPPVLAYIRKKTKA